jgi:Chaperone of endosialidase
MSIGYTPYLRLALNGNEEENRNWRILDQRALELARNVIANIPAGGDLTGFYPDPLIGNLKVTDGKIASVSWSKITGVPPATIQYWSDDGAILRPISAPRQLALDVDGAYYIGAVPGAPVQLTKLSDDKARLLGKGGVRLTHDTSTVADFTFPTGMTISGGVVLTGTPQPLPGSIGYQGGHFQGYNGTAWVNLDDTGGGGGSDVWVDEGAVSEMVTPATANRGIALTAASAGLVIRHSSYPTIDRNTGVDADDITLQLTSGSSGIVFRAVNLSAQSYMTNAGLWRLGSSTTPTERLEVMGGIQLAAALAAKDGTLQYTGTTFQGRVAGAWVDIPGAGAGAASGFKLWTFNATITTPPAAGEIRFNQTNQATVTLVYVSNTTSDGVDLKHLLPKLVSGQRLYIQDIDTGAKYAVYAISGTPIDQGAYTQYPVTWVENGSVITAEPVFLEVLSASASGGASWTQANPYITPSDAAVTALSLTNPVDASGTDQAIVRLTSASTSAAREPVITLRKARANGAAVSVSDVLARFDVTPCQGSSVFARSGFLAFSAAEGHTAGAKGTSFQLAVAPTGGGTPTSTLDFTQAGNVTISGIEYRAKQTQIIQQAAGYLEISSNQLGITGQNASIPTWIQRLDQTGDLWQVWRKPTPAGTAVALMTLDGTGKLTVPGSAGNASLVAGSRTAKVRVQAATTLNAGYFLTNATLNAAESGWVQDDNTKPSWIVSADSSAPDQFSIGHLAAGGAYTSPLVLDNVGQLTLPGRNAINFTRGHLVATTLTPGNIYLTNNLTLNAAESAWVQDNAANPSWMLTMAAAGGGDAFQVLRSAVGSTTLATLLSLDSNGTITTPSMMGSGSIIVGATGSFYRTRIVTPGGLSANAYWSGSWQEDDTSKPGWVMTLNPAAGVDNCTIQRMPASNGALVTLFTMGAGGDLQIFGSNAYKATGNSWVNPSDPRLKRDIAPYTVGLQAILALEPISFYYNGRGGTTDDGRQCYGYDASAVQSVLPECVGTRQGKLNEADEADTEILTLDTSNFTLALINAVKELAARVTALEAPA